MGKQALCSMLSSQLLLYHAHFMLSLLAVENLRVLNSSTKLMLSYIRHISLVIPQKLLMLLMTNMTFGTPVSYVIEPIYRVRG